MERLYAKVEPLLTSVSVDNLRLARGGAARLLPELLREGEELGLGTRQARDQKKRNGGFKSKSCRFPRFQRNVLFSGNSLQPTFGPAQFMDSKVTCVLRVAARPASSPSSSSRATAAQFRGDETFVVHRVTWLRHAEFQNNCPLVGPSSRPLPRTVRRTLGGGAVSYDRSAHLRLARGGAGCLLPELLSEGEGSARLLALAPRVCYLLKRKGSE